MILSIFKMNITGTYAYFQLEVLYLYKALLWFSWVFVSIYQVLTP